MKKNYILKITLTVIIIVSAAGAACSHEHAPPHKGALVEFGEEFAHLELVLDPASGKLTGYVLDGEAENPVRIRQSSIRLKLNIDGKPLALDLKAVTNPLTGETKGDTSEFSAVSLKLKGMARFRGIVALIKVKGKIFRDVRFQYPEGNEP